MEFQQGEKMVVVQDENGKLVFRKVATEIEISNICSYVKNCKKWFEGAVCYVQAQSEKMGF